MYQGNTDTTVKSALCYGVQWDVAIQFIDPNYTEYAKNSAGKGNYTGTIAVTGDKSEYAQKNISDMAGNVWEWTIEASHTSNRVIRGGAYNSVGPDASSSSRVNYAPDSSNDGFGFRPVLYW